jgi:hypothetical protein
MDTSLNERATSTIPDAPPKSAFFPKKKVEPIM